MSEELRSLLVWEREPDPLDGTIRASEIDLAVRLHNMTTAKEEGKGNGKCHECHKDIPEKRLAAVPNALRCVRCQGLWERENLQ